MSWGLNGEQAFAAREGKGWPRVGEEQRQRPGGGRSGLGAPLVYWTPISYAGQCQAPQEKTDLTPPKIMIWGDARIPTANVR